MKHLSIFSRIFLPLLFLLFIGISKQASAAEVIEFVPPNDPVGEVFTTNDNDAWNEGRGLVFEVMSDVTVKAIGVFHDVTGEVISYSIAQVLQTTGDVRTGQTILASGSQTFSNNGLEWNDITIAPITLTAGNFYHLEMSFNGNANQNFFYNNGNVAWAQGNFNLLEGTNDGESTNFVVPAFRFACAEVVVAAVPTLGQWGVIILSLMFLTFGVVSLRNRVSKAPHIG